MLSNVEVRGRRHAFVRTTPVRVAAIPLDLRERSWKCRCGIQRRGRVSLSVVEAGVGVAVAAML